MWMRSSPSTTPQWCSAAACGPWSGSLSSLAVLCCRQPAMPCARHLSPPCPGADIWHCVPGNPDGSSLFRRSPGSLAAFLRKSPTLPRSFWTRTGRSWTSPSVTATPAGLCSHFLANTAFHKGAHRPDQNIVVHRALLSPPVRIASKQDKYNTVREIGRNDFEEFWGRTGEYVLRRRICGF